MAQHICKLQPHCCHQADERQVSNTRAQGMAWQAGCLTSLRQKQAAPCRAPCSVAGTVMQHLCALGAALHVHCLICP